MKILLAEDDDRLAEYLSSALREEGHSVDRFADGREALNHCLYHGCDLAILDRMMPGLDGLSLLRALRAAGNDMPVLFLTAMAEVEDRVEGLSQGADDYLVKPFHISELLARVSVLSRRRDGAGSSPRATTELRVQDLALDLLGRTATRQGQHIALQNREFALLEVLMRNAGRVVTRTMLLEQVWSFNFEPHSTVVETHMSRLRAKVDKPFDCALIHTVRNTGYTMHGPR